MIGADKRRSRKLCSGIELSNDSKDEEAASGDRWKSHRLQGQASEENELLVLNWNCSVNDDFQLQRGHRTDSKDEAAASEAED